MQEAELNNAQFIVRKVAVLGAGVMGAQIAAHLVNANIETLLFELPADGEDANANVTKAIEKLKKLEPSPLSVKTKAAFIQAANYDHHLEKLADCDVVIEAIAERIDLKRALYEKVAPILAHKPFLPVIPPGCLSISWHRPFQRHCVIVSAVFIFLIRHGICIWLN